MDEPLVGLDSQELPPLSAVASRRRIEQATRILGAEVVSRVLALALYLLGARRKPAAELLAIPVDTMKSLVQRVFSEGLPALEDRRRKGSTFMPPVETVPPQTTCKLLVQQDKVVVEIDDMRRVEIPRRNPIQCRTVLMTMMEAGLLSLADVAKAVGLSMERVRKLSKKLHRSDVAALIDQRRGQQQDYRLTPEVKAELIQQFVLNLQIHAATSSRQLSEDLEKRCRIKVAGRTIREHAAKLGLGKMRRTLPELLTGLKKTPKSGGGGPSTPGASPS
jgi:hypothetical protein